MRNLKRKIDDEYKFKYSEMECPVCMDEMKILSRSVTVPCMHEFCLNCIGKWLMESSSQLCPICKQMVKKIIYSIESQQKYSIIGFPKDFCSAWIVRNKMKTIFHNFDRILERIYVSVKVFIEQYHCFDERIILPYLVWFANVKVRVKSRKSEEIVPKSAITDKDNLLYVITPVLCDRLNMIFETTLAKKIMNGLSNQNISTLNDIISYLSEFIDLEMLEILKMELQCSIDKDNNSDNYLEYYIYQELTDSDDVLVKHSLLINKKIVPALITKVLCSFNFVFDIMLLAHVSIVYEMHLMPEMCTDYTELCKCMSDTSHFIMSANEFYKKSKLKNFKKNRSNLISNNAYNLVKYSFEQNDFKLVEDWQKDFEKKYIYVEPVTIDDSSDEEMITKVLVEVSDSDEDALEMVSVHIPVIDSVEEVVIPTISAVNDISDLDSISTSDDESLNGSPNREVFQLEFDEDDTVFLHDPLLD